MSGGKVMARKSSAKTPAYDEIMGYDNVPVEVAAKYIGWSPCNIAYALPMVRDPLIFSRGSLTDSCRDYSAHTG